MIEIFAGETALKTIQENGFHQELFSAFLGASGGPKWFTLFGLDKYLFGNYFVNRTETMQLVGSSAGSFRIACFAQSDPLSAIERLAKTYSETVYSKKASREEITRKGYELVKTIMGEEGTVELLNNPIYQAHFLVNRSKGLVSSENRLLQSLGLLKSYLFNRVDRRLLKSQFERVVLSSPTATSEGTPLSFVDDCQFKTDFVQLSTSNFNDALMASGSIPMVMKGISNIEGTSAGMYRDGGIIDYHFDLRFKTKGLVLYPHFSSSPKAGWFDKNLNRKVTSDNYDNVVLIAPSKTFIESLPFQKIPDRTDFETMEAPQRIKYWKTVLSETERMAEKFDEFVNEQKISMIKRIGELYQ